MGLRFLGSEPWVDYSVGRKWSEVVSAFHLPRKNTPAFSPERGSGSIPQREEALGMCRDQESRKKWVLLCFFSVERNSAHREWQLTVGEALVVTDHE